MQKPYTSNNSQNYIQITIVSTSTIKLKEINQKNKGGVINIEKEQLHPIKLKQYLA